MSVYVYRPDHPDANEHGMVDRDLIGLCISSGAPNVITDYMDALRHHGDGRMYDSKSQFRAATKATGCIEIGNDSSYMNPKPRTFQKPPDDRRKRREAIRQSLYELRNRGR